MRHNTFAGLMAVAALAGAPFAARSEPAQPDAWAAAEQTFKEYIAPILQTARQRHGDPEIQAAEYRSDRLRKYLPDVRVHVRTGPYDGASKLFILSKDGKILDLGDGTWRGDAAGNRVPEVTRYVKGRKVPVRNAEEAIEAARLTEEIQGAPNYVGFLQINTAGFKVFDEHFISHFYGKQQDWKYSAEARGMRWIVRREYTGPPAMIQQPPVYEITVDDQKLFEDMRDIRYITPKP
jgi:hypothetical protein